MGACQYASKDIVAKLNAAVVAALEDPQIRARFADLGQEIFPRLQQTPEALGVWHEAEIQKWWPILKAPGIKQEWWASPGRTGHLTRPSPHYCEHKKGQIDQKKQ